MIRGHDVFNDRPAKFRSYETVVGIAEKARKNSGLASEININLIDYINGFLILRVGLPIDINIFTENKCETRAYVEFQKEGRIKLNVESRIWLQASQNFPNARFIMAHEVGHIIMHNHDALAYSNAPYASIRSLSEEERVEPQANWFADAFLAPIHMLAGLENVYDAAEYLNIPESCARRQLERMLDDQRRKGQIAAFSDMCPSCGSLTLDNNGKCSGDRGCK